jgi:dimethylaniline monooxygenase (N-oxide forming)
MLHCKYCIIGGGQSGIAACKTFSENTDSIVVLERQNECSGMFCNIKEKDYFRWSTSSYMSGFSDYPMDTSKSWFSIREYISYLDRYKKHFELERFFNYSCNVTKCTQESDEEWIVRFTRNYKKEELRCKYLIVCSGLNQVPKYPSILHNQNNVYHSQEIYYMDKYEWNSRFQNKRILLIGGSESAFDIGHMLVSIGAKVTFAQKNYIEWFSTGDEPLLNTEKVRKINEPCFNNIYKAINSTHPTDTLLSYGEYSMPEPLSALWHEYGRYILYHLIHDTKCNICIHSNDALCEATNTPNNLFQKMIVKRTEFLLDIHENKVKVIEYPSNISNGRVEYDNKHIDVDTIVCATGYQKSFPFLDRSITDDVFIKKIIPQNTKNIAFIGFARPTMGSIAPLAEMQSWWVQKYFEGCLQYSLRENYIFRTINPLNLNNEHIDSLVISCYYLKDLAKDLRIEPNLLKLFFSDYELFETIYFGSCHPMIYRIHGDKQYEGARDTLIETFPKLKDRRKDDRNYLYLFFLVTVFYYLIILVVIFVVFYIFRRKWKSIYNIFKQIFID